MFGSESGNRVLGLCVVAGFCTLDAQRAPLELAIKISWGGETAPHFLKRKFLFINPTISQSPSTPTPRLSLSMHYISQKYGRKIAGFVKETRKYARS